MALSWQIDVSLMWLSLKLQNDSEYHIHNNFNNGRFIPLSWQIHTTFPKVTKILDSWHFHCRFMAFSWQIHGTFPKVTKMLDSCHFP